MRGRRKVSPRTMLVTGPSRVDVTSGNDPPVLNRKGPEGLAFNNVWQATTDTRHMLEWEKCDIKNRIGASLPSVTNRRSSFPFLSMTAIRDRLFVFISSALSWAAR
jgi:hypothetical protein